MLSRTTDQFAVSLLPRSAYEARFTADRTRIGFAFDIQRGSHAIGTDRHTPFITRPSTVAVTPRGCDVFSQSAVGGEYLTIEPLDKDWHLPPSACTNRVVPEADQIAHALRRLMFRLGPHREELNEHAFTFVDLVEESLGDGPIAHSHLGSLTDRRLNTLNDFIEAHLPGDLGVDKMAAQVGLRPRHFMRAFKHATGTTPHAYVVERRLERARRLLVAGSQHVSDVAMACGFSSHAHLTSCFTKRFGVPPSAFRRHERASGSALRS